MSEAENYDDILDRSWDDVQKPQVLPDGSWKLNCRNASYVAAPAEDKSAKVLFFYEAVEPMDDVDVDALNALGDEYDISENDLVATFWVNKGKDWDKVRNHIKRHGIDVTGMTFKESFEAVRGGEIIGYLGTRTYENRAGLEVTDNEIIDFAEIE